jgi:hypothetical protein
MHETQLPLFSSSTKRYLVQPVITKQIITIIMLVLISIKESYTLLGQVIKPVKFGGLIYPVW